LAGRNAARGCRPEFRRLPLVLDESEHSDSVSAVPYCEFGV
jgi:hypothetical protein